MKLKNVLLTGLSLALVAVVSIGGTLAYLTDRDSEVNTFTVGDVQIKLEETFTQGAKLVPGVEIAKKPVITNTGNNDAWVWMTFSIPSALDNYVQGTETGSNENVIHWNPLGATAEGYVNETRVNNAITAGHLPAGITADEITTKNMTWNVFNSLGDSQNVYQEEINGVKYNTYVLLYNKALEAGETTLPSIFKVFLDTQVDIDPDGNWFRVVNGTATEIDWNTNEDGAPLIYVNAYAIQKEEFATVKDAYAAYGKQWGDNGSDIPVVVTASTNKELKDLVKKEADAGETNIIVNAGGANIGDLNYGINKAMVPAGTTVTISNAKVSGRSYGNAVDGTVVFENCTFENEDGAYSIHFDAGSGNVVFNNCTLSGWCSFGSAIKSVEMNNCTIKGNGIYAMNRFFQDTTLNNCIIDCSNAPHDDKWADGISAVNGCTVTMNDCDIVYSDFEYAENAKIVADGTTVAESVNNSEGVIKNADR